MAETRIKTRILSSLHKVFYDSCPEGNQTGEFSVFENEPLSFQLAYKLESEKGEQKVPFYLEVNTDLPLTAYSVGNVPVMHAEKLQDDAKRGPGLYPDMLLPKKTDAPIDTEWDAWCPWNFERDEDNNLIAYEDSCRHFGFALMNREAKFRQENTL